MNIIAVDDEGAALWALERAISEVEGENNLTCFTSAQAALNYAGENKIDVAFLDIEMARMNGLLLAKSLKEINGDMNIIFVTGFSDYAIEAFKMHASGYIMKPINSARIKEELLNLRKLTAVSEEGLQIHCFGNFEVFANNTPVFFSRPKAKEALAYLVDRKGAAVSKKELAAVLWEDTPYTKSIQSHLHILISDISASLLAAGAKDILIRKRGVYAVDTKAYTCDFYEFEKGDVKAVNCYHGEYMTNYGWGELRIGELDKRK